MTEWSMTNSTGHERVDAARVATELPDRVAHRREVHNRRALPVKSCMSTRSGLNAISLAVSAESPRPAWDAHDATPAMSEASTLSPSSWRRRFSRRIFRV